MRHPFGALCDHCALPLRSHRDLSTRQGTGEFSGVPAPQNAAISLQHLGNCPLRCSHMSLSRIESCVLFHKSKCIRSSTTSVVRRQVMVQGGLRASDRITKSCHRCGVALHGLQMSMKLAHQLLDLWIRVQLKHGEYVMSVDNWLVILPRPVLPGCPWYPIERTRMSDLRSEEAHPIAGAQDVHS